MKKVYIIVVALFILLLATDKITYAEETPAVNNVTTEVAKPVDVGNKICPVTGQEIDENTKATCEYDGKIYNFCCQMCVDKFKGDPQKYIKKIEKQNKTKKIKK